MFLCLDWLFLLEFSDSSSGTTIRKQAQARGADRLEIRN